MSSSPGIEPGIDVGAALPQDGRARSAHPNGHSSELTRLTTGRNKVRRCAPAWFAAACALAVSGCAIDSETFAIPELKKSDFTLTRPDWNVSAKNDIKLRPVTANDLVNADGSCAGDPMPAAVGNPEGSNALNFTAGPEAPRPDRAGPAGPAAPPMQPAVRGVGLGMTECEVIRTIGHTDRIELSANERGQRSAVLTYLQGVRPGIYRFAGGRLVSIERGPEPPAPPKPEKKTAKKQPAKKPPNS